MQTEIENVVLAFNKELKKERDLLFSFLKSLAVRSCARHNLANEIAEAVVKSRSTPQSPMGR